MNSPSSVKALSAPMAAPFVLVGRMIETAGKLRLRKMVGSGMTRLVWKSSLGVLELRSGNVKPFVGSVSGGASPAMSYHFAIWHDIAGDAPPLTDPTNGLTFPDLNSKTPSELFQTSLVMPEPTVFLKRKFPIVSIIRPTETEGAAMGALKALKNDGLFIGQSQEFFAVLGKMGREA